MNKKSHNMTDVTTKMTQLYQAQNYKEALSLGLTCLKRDKKNPTLLNMIGALQFKINAHDAAAQSFKRAIALAPDFADAHFNLGNLLRSQGHNAQAECAFLRALECNPNLMSARQNLANLLAEIGNATAAITQYELLLANQPNNVDVLNNYALALETTGDAKAACTIYERLLTLAPDFTMAHRNYSLVKRYKPDDPHIAQMESLLGQKTMGAEAATQLHFALGKAYDQTKNINQAFTHFRKGNALRHARLRTHYNEDRQRTPTILDMFADDNAIIALAERAIAKSGKQQAKMTFIVGMPRSGTSLVEQILASHSTVFGAGERGELENLCLQQITNSGHSKAKPMARMMYDVARGYRQTLPQIKSHHTHVTDKLPMNYRNVGFALAAMPESNVIWVRRDPVATCWSIFRSYFPSSGLSWAYDLDSIAAEYANHVSLMQRWTTIFPERVTVVDYEQLTTNPEPNMRAMLAAMGLEWEAACLAFHETKRDVRTLSATQVRQKLYTDSSKQYLAYSSHLVPLVTALQRHGMIP